MPQRDCMTGGQKQYRHMGILEPLRDLQTSPGRSLHIHDQTVRSDLLHLAHRLFGGVERLDPQPFLFEQLGDKPFSLFLGLHQHGGFHRFPLLIRINLDYTSFLLSLHRLSLEAVLLHGLCDTTVRDQTRCTGQYSASTPAPSTPYTGAAPALRPCSPDLMPATPSV